MLNLKSENPVYAKSKTHHGEAPEVGTEKSQTLHESFSQLGVEAENITRFLWDLS